MLIQCPIALPTIPFFVRTRSWLTTVTPTGPAIRVFRGQLPRFNLVFCKQNPPAPGLYALEGKRKRTIITSQQATEEPAMKGYTAALPSGEAIHYIDRKRWLWLLSVFYPLQPFA